MEPYLEIARRFYQDEISEESLLQRVKELPTLTSVLLKNLTAHADQIARSHPKQSWAIMMVAHETAKVQQVSDFCQALSAWQLARFSNHWGQPKLVIEAINNARSTFNELEEKGWVAACDWQLNALAWTKPSFSKAAKTLESALETLIRTNFDDFVPYCRMDLAYAQILTGKFDQAQDNLTICENYFASQENDLELAHCWVQQANLARRRGRFADTNSLLEKARMIFEAQDSLVGIAKTQYQTGLVQLLLTDNLSDTQKVLEKAAELFAACELDLWRAGCIHNIGAMEMRQGNFSAATKYYDEARERFHFHNTQGWLADNLNDSGKLCLLKGQMTAGIEMLKQARDLNERLGSRTQAAVVTLNLGEAHNQTGQYESALRYLEKAEEEFALLGDRFRLAISENFIARTWLNLGNPERALEHLDKAIALYQKIDRSTQLASIYTLRASILLEMGDTAAALKDLKIASVIAEDSGVLWKVALSKRMQGEIHVRTGDMDIGLNELINARTTFQEMQIPEEEAISLVALGQAHFQTGAYQIAQDEFEEALSLSQGDFPEVDWEAYAGLAQLAQEDNRNQKALQLYQKGLDVHHKIRNDFWQPALAGTYLQKPAEVIERAILLSIKTKSPDQTLAFIENNKAKTFISQLLANKLTKNENPVDGIEDLVGEINWLRKQLKSARNNKNWLQASRDVTRIRAQLHEKTQAYDALIGQHERRNFPEKKNANYSKGFIPRKFQDIATARIGKTWIALDYYLIDDRLITAVFTPEDVMVETCVISHRAAIALDGVRKAKYHPEQLQIGDLGVLGSLLIPQSVKTLLSPETTLIIAPHGKLHDIPWAVLQIDEHGTPLVTSAIPSVIPSLESLALLWERNEKEQVASDKDGILIGASDFRGRHPNLPYVKDEIAFLKDTFAKNAMILDGNDATWTRIIQDSATNRLSTYQWLHIASHVLTDEITGRLSGIALMDQDIRLDQIQQIAPLPALVSFSACNSIHSRVYEGDELLGLPTTCLLAGANHVIGSIWKLQDFAAAEFTKRFYKNYHDENTPAQALAEMQRKSFQDGIPVADWGGFTCVGSP